MDQKKINLMDVAFLIPVRIDSIVRMENLLGNIDYLTRHFNTNIYVLEADIMNNHILRKLLPQGVSYTFIKDIDPIFHRTRYINILSQKSFSQYIAIWDADVIVNYKQICNSISKLRGNLCDVSFPYDGHFYDTTAIIRKIYLEAGDFSILSNNIGKMILPYGSEMGGGALFVKRESFEFSGGENEKFYGWGPEDWNRIEKWIKFGYRIHRTDGPLFHLSHPRDLNGRHNSELQKKYSFNLLRETQMSSMDEIKCKLNNFQSNFTVTPQKLHIGCGSNLLLDWLNTDINPQSCDVMYMDASKPFPFQDNHFSFVFSEHVIEHLSFVGAISMLKEIFRVLKPEGTFRIATPSFEFLENIYTNPISKRNKKYIDWSLKTFCHEYIGNLDFDYKAKAVIVINNFVHNWGHHFIFNEKILETLLRIIGFVNIKKCKVGSSVHQELNDIEQHGRQIPEWANILETMVFEAQKGK